MTKQNVTHTSAPLLAELAVAIALGVISAYLGSTRTESLIISAFSFVSVEIVRIRLLFEKMLANYESFNLILNAFRLRDPFSELVLLYGLRSLYRTSSPTRIQMDLEDVLTFWRDSVARTKTQYLATSYALPSETWGREWAIKTMMSIHQERLSEGCKIERIFIVQSNEEITKLSQLMNKQALMGIDVYCVNKDNLFSKHYIRRCFSRIGSLDYAVVDDSWIVITHLDDQRQMKGSSASKDTELIKMGKELILEAKGIAIKLEPSGNVAKYY
jgi:hypothetical protein